MTEKPATDSPTAVTHDAQADPDAPSSTGPRVHISLLGWLWIGVATIPMAIVALGAIMAAINERRVGVIVVGGQWLWAVVLLGAVVASIARIVQWTMRRT